MKTRFLLLFFLVPLFAKAQNIEASGLQSGVWAADTVFVTGDVTVADSLRIAAGTTVVFNGHYGIVVEGNASLNAVGTATDSILFTVADTTGFHVFDSGSGGWNGIRLGKAGPTKFDYCRFQFGKAATDRDQDGGALRIFRSNAVEIAHSTLFCNFSRQHGGALNAEHSQVVILGCDINNNLTYSEIDTIYYMYGGGLRFLNCKVEITETVFRHNVGQSAIGGALSLDSCAVSIDRCKFEHNHGINGAGLYLIRSNHHPCSITNSLFADNTSEHFGGGMAISDASPLLGNLTVVGNHSIGVNCGGIFFYQHSSPVVWNCIVYGNTNDAPLDEPVQMWTWTYEGHAPEIHNCLIQFGLDNISNNDFITVYENCLEGDPHFSDPANANFRLALGSPCINAGSPDTPETILGGLDLDGLPRLGDAAVDMGAYEFYHVGVNESTRNESLMRIAGNPITPASHAEIGLDIVGQMFATVYSIDGKRLVDKCLGQSHKGVNRIALGAMFEPLGKGSYLLVVRVADRVFVGKVIR